MLVVENKKPISKQKMNHLKNLLKDYPKVSQDAEVSLRANTNQDKGSKDTNDAVQSSSSKNDNNLIKNDSKLNTGIEDSNTSESIFTQI